MTSKADSTGHLCDSAVSARVYLSSRAWARSLLWLSASLFCVDVSGCFNRCEARDPLQGEGVWVPLMGEVGRRPLLYLSIGGDGALYASGAGRVWSSPSLTRPELTSKAGQQNQQSVDFASERWRERGRYAPTLTWDEAEGISASGPFSPALLSEVERQIGESLESMLEGQGDEDWLTEDAVATLIDSFEDEALPPLDSPYRVNGAYPQTEGVWLTTGAGVWATTQSGVVPAPQSPQPALSITQAGSELWVSTFEGIFRTAHYLSDLQSVPDDRSLAWRQVSDLGNATLVRYQDQVYAFKDERLRLIQEGKDLQDASIPSGTQKLAVERYVSTKGDSQAQQERLWAFTQEGLWYEAAQERGQLAWRRCVGIKQPLAIIRPTSIGVLLVSPQGITRVSSDCQRVYHYRAPISESVMLTDAAWWNGKLYVATSGGLFSWEPMLDSAHSMVSLRYLKRDLALFPKLFPIYRAALKEQELDPRSGGYGARPVLSALVPQLRFRYITTPSRDDQLPTFNVGSRQLTLLQPTHNFDVFLEWRISLDFLTTLIDPERTSAYSETQSQLETMSGDPLSSSELEAEAGLFEEWTEDTFTSQAQRLALTTLALERRQMHRDRHQLRTYISRLHRERVSLTYRRWLSDDPVTSVQSQERVLRLQEIDALLDATTGYRLKIQRTMMPPL